MNELSQLFSQISFVQLVLQSGPVALALLGLIAIMSIVSWGMILAKIVANRKERSAQKAWKKQWSSSTSLISLKALSHNFPQSSVQRIAKEATLEIQSLGTSSSRHALESRKSILQETLDRSIELEIQQSHTFLSTLSLFSSIAPFLGLLGTVWGIMHAFLEIGQQSSASLNVVAPGIAEALITTIAGLLVAIPSSAAYYLFTSSNKKFELYWYNLGSEIVGLFQKQGLHELESTSKSTSSTSF
jgi:biopolymer transport protein TolQ